MTAIRRYFRTHSALAALVLLAALAVRVAVPAGFMPVAQGGSVTVQICSGTGPMTMAMPAPSKSGDPHQQSKADMPCAFAGAALSFLSAADPILLAGAIAFVLALAPHAAPPLVVAQTAYLRPPLRGPPLPA